MHCVLVMIGAHDGFKMERQVREAAALGRVLLVEPVPFLFERLSARYAGSPNISLRNIAVATTDGEAMFTAPKQSANAIVPYADQLGSLLGGHAVGHDSRLSGEMELIRVRTSSFGTLLTDENITSLDVLLTDTEGMDADLLPTFPFDRVLPGQIVFEFKHADGVGRVGRKLAKLLTFLDDLGYDIGVMDGENMSAVRRTAPGAPGPA